MQASNPVFTGSVACGRASKNARRNRGATVSAAPIYVRARRPGRPASLLGIDLALALWEEDFGHALALEVARDLVMYLKRPGGQSQFSVQPASQGVTHRDIQAVQSIRPAKSS